MSTVKFIPVTYSNKKYPSNITSQIQEASANFFRQNLDGTKLQYLSLHTDPGRRWAKDKIRSSELLNQFPAISNNMFDMGSYCVSKLWFNRTWGKEFAGFLAVLAEGIEKQRIKVIEIHPPFDVYCNSLESFLERYAIFEEEILKAFPTALINIENRCNPSPKRKGGKFVLSSRDDIIKLATLVSGSNLKLKLVVDFPQLFSEHYGNRLLTKTMIREVIAPFKDIRDFISGTHIWGININDKWRPHDADLNIYFDNDQRVKDCFLREICELFDDDKARYFVPEVSKTSYVHSIVSDLISAGIVFVGP